MARFENSPPQLWRVVRGYVSTQFIATSNTGLLPSRSLPPSHSVPLSSSYTNSPYSPLLLHLHPANIRPVSQQTPVHHVAARRQHGGRRHLLTSTILRTFCGASSLGSSLTLTFPLDGVTSLLSLPLFDSMARPKLPAFSASPFEYEKYRPY